MLQREEYLIRDLLEGGVIDEDAVDRAKAEAAQSGKGLTDALVDIEAITHRDLAIARASLYECTFVDLNHFEIDLSLAELLPKSVAEKHCAMPLFSVDDVVTVGMRDPMDFKAVDQIRAQISQELSTVHCEPNELAKLVSRAYSVVISGFDPSSELTKTDLTTGEEPIVAAVRSILDGAIDAEASDIHISADAQQLHLRYRVDGVLRVQQGPPRSAHGALVRRIKVLAGLDLTQTRKPQDGKFQFSNGGKNYDIRCSIIPTVEGESVVLRVLKPDGGFASLDELGITGSIREGFESALRMPHGLILVTGPTGSGKTSTLYTALGILNTPERNIMTVEDPVEVRLPMIRQTQVNASIGLDFATTLRSMLRQDPDVILVGEIRDAETAQTAVQASLTGHLVLTTLHTNDAIGAIDRLVDLGAPPFAISCSLLCSIGQRLVRRLCPHCAVRAEPTTHEREMFGLESCDCSGLKSAVGCSNCSGTGYAGRLGVYELLEMTSDIRTAIHEQVSATTMHDLSRRNGMRSMYCDGLEKALAGVTSLEELGRVRATIEDRGEGAAAAPAVRLSA